MLSSVLVSVLRLSNCVLLTVCVSDGSEDITGYCLTQICGNKMNWPITVFQLVQLGSLVVKRLPEEQEHGDQSTLSPVKSHQ